MARLIGDLTVAGTIDPDSDALWIEQGGLPRQVSPSQLGLGGSATIASTWKYENSTVEADPGNGDLRTDNNTQASVTEVFISAISRTGQDFDNVLGFLSSGDSIYLQTVDDATQFLLLDITATVDNTGWWSIAGTVGASGSDFQNNKDVGVILLFGGTGGGGGGGALDDLTDVSNPVEVNHDILVATGSGYVASDTLISASDYFRFGNDTGGHTRYLRAGIEARNNTATSALAINPDGGTVTIGGATGFSTSFVTTSTPRLNLNHINYVIQFQTNDAIFWDNVNNAVAMKAFQVENAAGNDNLLQTHDGTDYNWVGTNTADWNVSGITALNAGAMDADFDAITGTSYGGILEANLVDKSVLENITGERRFDGLVKIQERAAAGAATAAYGQYWVDDAVPNLPFFTDDTDVNQLIDPSISEINEQNGNYTLLITDKGKTIRKASGGSGETITIPANSSVPFPIGTLGCVQNDGGGTLTVAITTDVLIFADDGSTGSRIIADDGYLVFQKITATSWKCAGRQVT